MLGPFFSEGSSLSYRGNKLFKSINEVRGVKAPDLSLRYKEVAQFPQWPALMKIWGRTFDGIVDFMRERKVLLFDLPVLTRMISSPGALTGTIASDVHPFEVPFFDQRMYLTQSSQLYLEFAIGAPGIEQVYCWEKSFRRERADFRHLPEFTHIEYEGRIDFEHNLAFQEDFLRYLIRYVLEHAPEEVGLFVSEEDVVSLEKKIEKPFQRITFTDAFKELKKATGDEKYATPTIRNFGAWEEVLLTQLMDNAPVFVTDYVAEEVAFYHQNRTEDPTKAINADLLFPGYGEIIGSGQRVGTEEETRRKAEHFRLDMEDYESYIQSRSVSSAVHSGWGMGIERFLQTILKIPFIWETKAFPRVDNSTRP